MKHSDTFAEALKKAGATDLTYLRIEGEGPRRFQSQGRRNRPRNGRIFCAHDRRSQMSILELPFNAHVGLERCAMVRRAETNDQVVSQSAFDWFPAMQAE